MAQKSQGNSDERRNKEDKVVEPDAALQIRLFGPMDVRLNGEPLSPLRSRKGYWLLALLILRHDREVRRDWLAGTLWPDSPDDLALMSLRRSLNDLRQSLGSFRDCLLSPTPRTLSFDLRGAFADVQAFDRAVASDNEAAWEEAAALYRGPLLEGCLEEWVLQERDRREESLLTVLEKLAQRAIERDEAARAVGFLKQAVRLSPLRESAQRALMTAQAASGDYAAVTQTYRDLRLTLREMVNAEPDAETTTRYQQLRAEARNRAEGGKNHGEHGEARGKNDLTTENTERHREREENTRTPGFLPNTLTPLIGREEALATIRGEMEMARLVCLTGIGGVGKTRLAIEAARESREDYPQGVWFISLTAVTEAERLVQTVAAPLELTADSQEALWNGLRDRDLMLVLDNCEHLIEPVAAFVHALLLHCPKVRILATSRQPLSILGETIYSVPPLELPSGTEGKEGPQWIEFGAVRLFVERVQAHRKDFALTPERAATVAHICRRLDGIPLALELAAARVQMLTLDQIAARLEDRFRLLTGGRRGSSPQHQTLQATMDWSYQLLTEAERRLLRRMAVFVGGCTLASAQTVCGEDEEDEWAMLDLLTRLADKSLVGVEEDRSGTARYRMLETVRQYAQERLQETEEEERLREKHLACFHALVQQAEPHLTGPEQGVWMDRLEADHDNIRAALKWAVEPRIRLEMASALCLYWVARGYLSEGRGWLEGVVAHPQAQATTPVRAKALNGAGIIAMRQDDQETALRYFEEALALRRTLGMQRETAGVLNNIGTVLNELSQLDAARACLEEAISLNREMGNRVWEAIALNNLGSVMNRLGDEEAGADLFRQALAINRETGNRNEEVGNLMNLGNIAVIQGRLGQASELYEEAFACNREIGNRIWEVTALNNLARVASLRGDLSAAKALCREALEQIGKHHLTHQLPETLEVTASVVVQEDLLEQAAHLLGIAATLRDAHRIARYREEESSYAPCVAAVRAGLGDAMFETIYAQGAKLTPEQATALARSVLP